MSIQPDPALNHATHPDWCSPDHCQAGAAGHFGDHRSAPVVIEPAERFDVKVALWLQQYAYETPDAAETYVVVRLMETGDPAWGELNDVRTVDLKLPAASKLGATLVELATIGARGGESR